jgi:inorganic pyrophosphatase
MPDVPAHTPVPLALGSLPALDSKGRVQAVIEAAAGSRNKLKFDTATGVLMLHTMLPLGASFPYAFGFVPSTLGEDGDPLDVMVFLDEQVPPGVVVPCRLVGVILATQTKDGAVMRNDRLLAVADKSHSYRRVNALADLDRSVLEEIERFFMFYNAQKGEKFTPLGRQGAKRAEALMRKGCREFARQLA